jgi:hypothetical protein
METSSRANTASSITTMPVEVLISNKLAEQISSQLNEETKGSNGKRGGGEEPQRIRASASSLATPTKTPSKSRSFSESIPKLSPSPRFREPRRETRDDTTIEAPKTPKRPDFLARGLSLQMPPKDLGMPSPAHFLNRAPLSPQLDRTNTYGSPINLLPRRSRGAEFSRACTNLHHSTLAEQSSPDSSPTITQKAMNIPGRSARNSMVLDSPGMSNWSNGERTAVSSSLGSINMLGSDSSSSDSDLDDALDDDNDDPMLMTPQAMRPSAHLSMPMSAQIIASPGGWPNAFSPGGPNFMSIQRARLRKGRSRKSSSSASGHSAMASPGPASPPQGKNSEGGTGGYFNRDAAVRKAKSRRESLSVHTNDLHISSGNDSGDEAGMSMPTTPGVVRRAVTRRGNLLVSSFPCSPPTCIQLTFA